MAGAGPNYADWKAALQPEDEQAAAALGCLELLRHGYTAFVEPGTRVRARRRRRGRGGHGRPLLARRSLPVGRPDHAGRDRRPQERQPHRARAGRPPAGARSSWAASSSATGTRTGSSTATSRSTARAPPPTSCCLPPRPWPTARGSSSTPTSASTSTWPRRWRSGWGRPRFAYLAELGVLGPNTTFVHMNVIRDGDVDPILASGLSIVWCPQAYVSRGTPLRLPTRIPEMRRRGANVALGTDSARQSTVGDAPFLALNLAAEAGQPIVSEDVIEMVTLGGARAAGTRAAHRQPGARQACRHRGAAKRRRRAGAGDRPRAPARGRRARADRRHGAGQRPGRPARRPLHARRRGRGHRRGARLGGADGEAARPRAPAAGRGRAASGRPAGRGTPLEIASGHSLRSRPRRRRKGRALTAWPMHRPCSRPRTMAGRKWMPPYRREMAASRAAWKNELKDLAGRPRSS